jgi:hypothetical protein
MGTGGWLISADRPGPRDGGSGEETLSLADIDALPAVVDVVTAGRALGLGRTKSYELARAGDFPCRLIRVGKTYLVRTAELITLLGLTPRSGSTDANGE